jgi:hypothetical protein
MTSERPEGLSPMEREQYELAIEEQAYPFEEKAIEVHESNLRLISRGVYNEWIDKSLQKLAAFLPARYAKAEETTGILRSLDSYVFEIERPVRQAAANSPLELQEPEVSGVAVESGPADPGQAAGPDNGAVTAPGEFERIAEPGTATETDPEGPAALQESDSSAVSRPQHADGDADVSAGDALQ